MPLTVDRFQFKATKHLAAFLLAAGFLFYRPASVQAVPQPLPLSNYPGIIVTGRETVFSLKYRVDNPANFYFWLDDSDSPEAKNSGQSFHGLITKQGGQWAYRGERYDETSGQNCSDQCSDRCCYLNYRWDVGQGDSYTAGSGQYIYIYSDNIDRTEANLATAPPTAVEVARWRLLAVNQDKNDHRLYTVKIKFILHDFFENKRLRLYLGAGNQSGQTSDPFWQKESGDIYSSANDSFFAAAGYSHLAGISANQTQAPVYGKFEISFLGLVAANPYDPDSVDIWAELTSPSGKHYRQNAFFYTEFTQSPGGDYWQKNLPDVTSFPWSPGHGPAEILTPGRQYWKLRFSPDEAGDWTYRLKMKDAGGEISLPPQHFQATPSEYPAPISTDSGDHSYFATKNGRFFFGAGTNNNSLMSDPSPNPDSPWGRGTYIFQEQLEEMAANKMNILRLGPGENWGFSFEWAQSGLGNYDGRQKQAWALDRVIDLARAKNIYVIPVFEWQGEVNGQAGGSRFNEWRYSPYNKLNGGPLTLPEEFFTNNDAKKYYKRKLRYLAARYFYSRNILFYEIWSEFPVNNDWLTEMEDYLKDPRIVPLPHRRLLGISHFKKDNEYLNNSKDIEKGNYQSIDVPSWHFYFKPNKEGDDGTMKLYNKIVSLRKAYRKPVVVGESDIIGRQYDPYRAEHWRQSLWASLMAKGAVGAMPWSWYELHNENRYAIYRALDSFLAGDDLRGTEMLRPYKTKVNNQQMRAFVLKKPGRIWSWVQDKRSDWAKQIYQPFAGSISGGTVTLEQVENGPYRLQIIDTGAGQTLADRQITAENNTLSVSLPTFSKDIAFKLVRINSGASPAPTETNPSGGVEGGQWAGFPEVSLWAARYGGNPIGNDDPANPYQDGKINGLDFAIFALHWKN